MFLLKQSGILIELGSKRMLNYRKAFLIMSTVFLKNMVLRNVVCFKKNAGKKILTVAAFFMFKQGWQVAHVCKRGGREGGEGGGGGL